MSNDRDIIALYASLPLYKCTLEKYSRQLAFCASFGFPSYMLALVGVNNQLRLQLKRVSGRRGNWGGETDL